jgi:hypothetical protein
MPLQATSVDKLFLSTLNDLKYKITSQDPNHILKATALLRLLIVDKSSLVDQVNRHRKLNIVYTINDKKYLAMEYAEFWAVQDGFDPEASPFQFPLAVNKDKLLKRASMVVHGKVFTVQDLIRYLSHVQGTVHVQDPQDAKEKMLKSIEGSLLIGGLQPVARSICAISRVVLKGLEPLKQEILKTDR